MRMQDAAEREAIGIGDGASEGNCRMLANVILRL